MPWFFRKLSGWFDWQVIMLIPALTAPCIIDWSTQAMRWRESNNYLRIIVGAMFAGGCIIVVRFLYLEHFSAFIIGSAIIFSEGTIALKLLQSAGAIDLVLVPYNEYSRNNLCK